MTGMVSVYSVAKETKYEIGNRRFLGSLFVYASCLVNQSTYLLADDGNGMVVIKSRPLKLFLRPLQRNFNFIASHPKRIKKTSETLLISLNGCRRSTQGVPRSMFVKHNFQMKY